MKKILLLTGLIMCAIGTFASHLMGGQITARQLNGLQYELTLTLYRDTLGIPISNETLKIKSTDTAVVFNVSRVISKPSAVSMPNGVEEYTYIDTITLPAATTYSIEYSNCCRNFAILNMSQPGGENLFLTTNLDASGVNSTPEFLNRPITSAQLNTLFTYNPLPFDADGDSLVWSLVTPLGMNGSPVNGYVMPSADTSQLFVIDSITGQISWMPNLMGHFVASILVEEFRSGVKIGEIRRDMQIIVLSPVTNQNRIIFRTQNWPLNAKGYHEFWVKPGTPLNITLTVKDDDNDSLRVDAVGELFLKGGYYVSLPGLINASATMSWVPSAADARTAPYITVFRGSEFHNGVAFPNDISFLVKVVNLTSVEDVKVDFASVYPNPVQSGGSLTIPFVLDKSSFTKVTLLNTLGQTVEVLHNAKLPAGQNVLIHQLNKFAPGMYFLQLETSNGVQSQRLIIE